MSPYVVPGPVVLEPPRPAPMVTGYAAYDRAANAAAAEFAWWTMLLLGLEIRASMIVELNAELDRTIFYGNGRGQLVGIG